MPGRPTDPTLVAPPGHEDGASWRASFDVDATLRELTRVDLPEPGPPQGPGPGGAAPALPLPAGFRYDGLLGRGAMGEVHRVHDPALNRSMALKVLQPATATSRAALQRFYEEAQITAQLQHPGIVPVHQAGRLPDGRLYFLMQEVRGRTLTDVIAELHAASSTEAFGVGPSGLSFRRVIDLFRDACTAVAYAHARGVVHRDLKPDNLMVGLHGELLVMDWGIAKVLGRAETVFDDAVITTARDDQTRAGAVFGTPSYMAPEQARGQVDLLDARTDVWALGAILFTILYGQRPYRGTSADQVLARVGRGQGPDPVRGPGPPVPPELEVVRARAMAAEPDARHPDAAVLAAAIVDWLDGAARREQALALVAEAAAAGPRARALRAQADEERRAASARLAVIPPWACEERKGDAWDALDRAEALEARAEFLEIEAEQLLQGALGHDPDNVEARTLLAERWREAHARASDERDAPAARRAEALWRAQVAGLPARSEARARHEALLRGEGALTVLVAPAGGRLTIAPYQRRRRRLVTEESQDLGCAPLIDLALPAGSYLLTIEAPSGAVPMPVEIGRGRVTVVAGDPAASGPLRLPAAGELGPDDLFVGAGWSRLGGDPFAIGGRAARLAWVPSFAIRRHPVTNAEYLRFLDDLVRLGREAEALAHVPREKAGTVGAQGAVIYGRRPDGSFVLRADADGDVWLPDWPVFNVTWDGAAAYCAWYAERTGLPWRLPTADERERAGRGADGRFFPWGDEHDPSWCCMSDSRPGRAQPASVHQFPDDVSPFGVRGLAGNVRDWCLDQIGEDRRIDRGGFWLGSARESRLADQHDHVVGHRAAEIGFRLARAMAPLAPGG